VRPDAQLPLARLAMLISQAQRNTHGVVDLEGHNLGHGLYPLASFFNHACAPNAVSSFCGQVLQVRQKSLTSPVKETYTALLTRDAAGKRGLYRAREPR